MSDARSSGAPVSRSAPTPLPEPQDRCVRCGRPVPAGVSLCKADNPARIASPSATQAHGTILIGVIVGFVLFAFAARLATGTGGPFEASIQGRASRADGGAEVVIRVVNSGESAATATCRVTRDGLARQEDYTFRTERLDPGATVDLPRSLPAPAPGTAPYDVERLTISCT